MTILLAVLAATFAAFCVWLTMRIVNRRKRWAKWTLAAVVGVPLLYVLSFGPACWLTCHYGTQDKWLFRAYAPFVWTLNNDGPDFIFRALVWYSLVAAPDGCGWQLDESGSHFIAIGRFR